MAPWALVSGSGRSRVTERVVGLVGEAGGQAEDEGQGEEVELRFLGHPREGVSGRRDGIPSLRRG